MRISKTSGNMTINDSFVQNNSEPQISRPCRHLLLMMPLKYQLWMNVYIENKINGKNKRLPVNQGRNFYTDYVIHRPRIFVS